MAIQLTQSPIVKMPSSLAAKGQSEEIAAAFSANKAASMASDEDEKSASKRKRKGVSTDSDFEVTSVEGVESVEEREYRTTLSGKFENGSYSQGKLQQQEQEMFSGKKQGEIISVLNSGGDVLEWSLDQITKNNEEPLEIYNALCQVRNTLGDDDDHKNDLDHTIKAISQKYSAALNGSEVSHEEISKAFSNKEKAQGMRKSYAHMVQEQFDVHDMLYHIKEKHGVSELDKISNTLMRIIKKEMKLAEGGPDKHSSATKNYFSSFKGQLSGYVAHSNQLKLVHESIDKMHESNAIASFNNRSREFVEEFGRSLEAQPEK